jgi:hypothetical protein
MHPDANAVHVGRLRHHAQEVKRDPVGHHHVDGQLAKYVTFNFAPGVNVMVFVQFCPF